MNDLPWDADGVALRKMAERGMDMTKSIRFEFYIHVKNKLQADAVLLAIQEAMIGDEVEVVYDKGELLDGEEMTEENCEFCPSWSVYVYCDMVPNYKNLIDFQHSLTDVSYNHGGVPDGWGVAIINDVARKTNN